MTSVHPSRAFRPRLGAAGRHRLARVTKWRPGVKEIRLDRLLLGGQNGLTAQQFAGVVDDPLWPSRRVVDGPHAELLRRARRSQHAGRELTTEDILASSYAEMALACIRHTGSYFEAVDADGVLAQARRFVARASDPSAPVVAGHQHSAPGLPVLVVPVESSECYQVLDGHHRVAAMAEAGVESVPARVRRGAVRTPLQELLQEMSWLDGGHELYQPIDAPEVASWPTVRRCTDRLESIWAFLVRSDMPAGSGASYLDVASCYGWFVSRMQELGFEAEGIERDPLGARLGSLMYGLDPARIRTGDAVQLLRSAQRRWDVVSCFSLLHHFVLGRGDCTDVELVQLLDSVTGKVLFLDTGQEHERWFRKSLRGWDTDHVREYLLATTTFDRVVDLGPDSDDVAPYAGNYGRHLFACVRD
ncbi:ParB N-terminal domain-containing protein [Nocardioides sp. zg-ZUI104]|uniref:ParB N-terminal domain-containing protein n=1 Tax=Nocardioides faecalis TaxID=2803858 RepID=UPI001BCAD0E7|nr:ParB N-terminal domain-containing protein [Nocardioides faecalis]MBS4752891.1 ParB N-terminal domain-containing protein [Nocardioides faecalis]